MAAAEGGHQSRASAWGAPTVHSQLAWGGDAGVRGLILCVPVAREAALGHCEASLKEEPNRVESRRAVLVVDIALCALCFAWTSHSELRLSESRITDHQG